MIMTSEPARPVLISVELLMSLLSYASRMERDSNPYLRARYGITERTFKRRLKNWMIAAIALLLIGGGWLIWSADHFAKPEISSQVITFHADSPQQISIRYYISVRTASKSHQCVLIASDYQANTVGEVTDLIPAGVKSYTRTIAIPTRAAAVAASIDHCS
jgi:hypothetical protein